MPGAPDRGCTPLGCHDNGGVILPPALAQEMIAHAAGAPLAPNGVREEACGILAGNDSRPLRFYPTTNSEHSPTRYAVDSQEQVRIMSDIYKEGWDLLGIFHSHTHTAAYPSSTDVDLAVRNWPDILYLIASLQHDTPELRAFRITAEGRVEEEEITYSEA